MKQQARYEAVWQPRILSAINRMMEPFIVSVRDNGPVVALAAMDSLVQGEPLLTTLSRLYNTVGVQAANDEYRHYIETYPELMNRQKAFGFNAWWRNIITNFFNRIGAEKVQGITDTVRNRLRSVLEQSADEGLTNYQLAQRLRSDEIGAPRSRVIARTETGFAGALGQDLAAQQSGLELSKVWISARRNTTRRLPRDSYDHWTLDGVKVGPMESFFVMGKTGGEFMRFPHDPNGSAGDTINCLCACIREL